MAQEQKDVKPIDGKHADGKKYTLDSLKKHTANKFGSFTQINIEDGTLLSIMEGIESLTDTVRQLANGKKLGLWLTESEVSKDYEVSIKTIRKWRQQNGLPFSTPPGKKGYLYARSDIEKFLEKHRNDVAKRYIKE